VAIQNLWENEKAVLFNGIVFSNDETLELFRIGSKDKKEVRVGVSGNLADIIRNGVGTTTIDVFASATDQSGDLMIACGDGAFGSDGFVCCLKKNKVSWFLFMDDSNPFVEVQINGDVAKVRSSLDEVWSIPLHRPQDLSIEDPANTKKTV
jgi:hypothetical protein